jgi:predicted Zn-ribbon and HTH transcriptional regulator
MTEQPRSPFSLETLKHTVDRAIFKYRHNVIIFWGELGEGKTTLMLRVIHHCIKDWKMILSFVLEPKVCLHCGKTWQSHNEYKFEILCPECGTKATTTTRFAEAFEAARRNWWVEPFPVDIKTGTLKAFPEGTKFSICEGKARGRIVHKNPYLNFSFNEIKSTIESAVYTRIRLPVVGWDDVAVYFHRSNIQYMHPDVKNFFSRYSFVRQYIANLLITVPTIEFVPEQLFLFCTADVLLQQRGRGDFDTKKAIRSFVGKSKTWIKSYDGRNVMWRPVDNVDIDPDVLITDEGGHKTTVMDAYEEIRHAHAVEAFEKPEEIFVTSMPKTKEFTEADSLLGGD